MTVNMDKKKTAILVIDCARDIVYESGAFVAMGFAEQAKKHNVLGNIARLLDAGRKGNMVVIYVSVEFRTDYKDNLPISRLFKAVEELNGLKIGAHGTEIADELKPRPSDYMVIKKRVNAFYNTNLEVILRRNGVDTLILTGVATNYAIESTARYAHDAGYHVYIPRDCCCSRNEQMHNFTLDNVLPLLVNITTSPELLEAFEIS